MTSLAEDTSDSGAVSWAAVFAGAVGAAAFSLILILLGTGLGLSVISPWAHDGVSAVTASVSTIVWITVVQILASVLGGYLAGRLRTRWTTVHTHEVYFRDTAHGFLAWCVATLLMATLLSTAVGAMVTTGIKATVAGTAVAAAGTAAAAGAGAAGKDESSSDPTGYFVDSLFRGGEQSQADKTAEVARIFANGLKSGSLGSDDTAYLAQLVASNTGLSQAEATSRVTDAFTGLQDTLQQARDKAKQVADDARKASAYAALWLVISLLIGAFVASYAATFGGRLRDSSVLANR